jgi:hypothetical protein
MEMPSEQARMTAPISLAQQAEACDMAATYVWRDGGVYTSALRAAASTLRSLAEPPSDGVVAEMDEWLDKRDTPNDELLQRARDRIVMLGQEQAHPTNRWVSKQLWAVVLGPKWQGTVSEATSAVGAHIKRISALEARLAAAQARIPREPTQAMIDIGLLAQNVGPDHDDDMEPYRESIRKVWRDMYDAAQSQESGG